RSLPLLPHFANFVLHPGHHSVHVDIACWKIGRNPVANPPRWPRAHVRLHEDREQPAQEFLINQSAFALEQIANVGVENVMRLLQSRSQHAEEALLRRSGLFFPMLRRTPLPCSALLLVGLFLE